MCGWNSETSYLLDIEPKKGAACYRMLACAHVFCVECLQDFYNTCITEGDITNVKCLDPDCGKESKPAIVAQNTEGTKSRKKRRKEDRTLGPSELLQIPLEQEIVQRYVKLKRKKKLESDPTTVYCPRQWCQGPARSKKHSRTSDFDNVAESESEDEDQPENVEPATHAETSPQPDQRLAICEDCAFAFCKICKSSWHGEFVRCRPLQKYGLTAEEKASEEYLKLHTSPCPTCTAPCQKTMGCNHMICFKCNTHFCYLCSAWLDTNNPYAHYNTLKSPCNQRLWELEGGDGGEDVGLGFGGGPQDGDQIHDVLLPWEEVEVLDEDSDDDPPPPLPPPAPAPPRAAPIPRVVLPPVIIRPGPAIPPAAGPQPRRGNGNPRRVNPEPGIRRPPADGGNVPIANGGNVPIANGGGRGVGGRGLAGHGLQRFLRMVEDDEEDEWDSDELDDDDEEGLGGNWEIPIR